PRAIPDRDRAGRLAWFGCGDDVHCGLWRMVVHSLGICGSPGSLRRSRCVDHRRFSGSRGIGSSPRSDTGCETAQTGPEEEGRHWSDRGSTSGHDHISRLPSITPIARSADDFNSVMSTGVTILMNIIWDLPNGALQLKLPRFRG